MTDTVGPLQNALNLLSTQSDTHGAAPTNNLATATALLNGANISDPNQDQYASLETSTTPMEKFGASVGNAAVNTFNLGPRQALLSIAAHFEDDPNGPYHTKAHEIADEIEQRKKMYAPAVNSLPGFAGTIAEKGAEQLATLPLGAASGAKNAVFWLGEGLAQPGSIPDRLQSGASNLIASVLGNAVNTGINKATNAVERNWAPGKENVAAKDIDLRANGLRGSYSAYREPSASMLEFHNFITDNGNSANSLVDSMKNVAANVKNQSQKLWGDVEANAQAAGNPLVDASNTASAVRTFIDNHGVNALVAGAPDVPTAARLMVLAKPNLYNNAVSLLTKEGRTLPEAERLVQSYMTQGTQLPFSDFRQVQQGVGTMSSNLRRSASASGQAEAAAHKAYASTFDDLSSITNNPQTAAAKNWGGDLLDSLKKARDYSRDVAFPWETGRARTPEGKEVNLPILNALARGQYDTNPTQVIKDVLNAKNTTTLGNYYNNVLDPQTQRLINGVQAAPDQAAAWARGQRELAGEGPNGTTHKIVSALTGNLDRNAAYKNFMFANPDIVPPPPGSYNAPQLAKYALKQGVNVGTRGGLQALSEPIGLGSALALDKSIDLAGGFKNWVVEHLPFSSGHHDKP